MGLHKGQKPKNFEEMQKKGWDSIRGKPAWNRGQKTPIEVRLKQRLVKLGKKFPNRKSPFPFTPEHIENLKGRIPWNKGKTGLIPPEKHPRWKGGISKNPSYNTFMSIRRRSRKKASGGSHTLIQWGDLKKKYDNMCLCCECFEPTIGLTEDHVIPLKHNGSDDILNIQPLCLSCNSRKSTTKTDFRFNILLKQTRL